MDKTKIIELLNRALNEELTSVNQYMYFHFKLGDLGFDLLASMFKRVSIVEMMHCEQIAERIFFLGGDVDMVSGKPQKLHTVKDIIQRAIELEELSVDDYNRSAQICSEQLDSASRKLFVDLIVEEEKHLDTFRTELDNLERFKENYLALQSLDRTQTVAVTDDVD